MKFSRQFKKNVEFFLKVSLTTIGPEDKLDLTGDLKTYSFEDDLKMSEAYFVGGYVLRNGVMEMEKELQGKTNDDFAYSIFEELVKRIYRKIKERTEITDTLNKYLANSDIDFACETLRNLLDQAYGEYTVTLITDLVDLVDVHSIQVGNVRLIKIDENFVKDLPESFESRSYLSLLLDPNRGDKITREDFLKENTNLVAFLTEASGYHYKNERSGVFEDAVSGFKQVFAYLAYAKHFFENVREKTFELKTRRLEQSLTGTEPKGVQKYYVRRKEDKDYLKWIVTRWAQTKFSRRVFIVDSQTSEELKKKCFLEEYNDLMRKVQTNRIAGKVRRSFDWFLKGVLEDDPTDQVVTLFTSLEALLSSGPDPFRGSTDDLAENVAIMLTRDGNERYEYKQAVKKAYSLRCKIVHGGETISEKDLPVIRQLQTYTVWSLRGILAHLQEIFYYGNGDKHLQEYFDREKLRGGIVIPPVSNE